MKETKRLILVVISFPLLFQVPFAFADDDRHKNNKEWYKNKSDHDDDKHEKNILHPSIMKLLSRNAGLVTSPINRGCFLPDPGKKIFLTFLPTSEKKSP